MYLTAEIYLSPYSEKPEEKEKIARINEMFGIKNSIPDYTVKEVIFRVGYWRKANAIHGWFVNNLQNGIDECQHSYVERKQLKELLLLCKQVLADHSTAQKLLPTTSGFFFGSYEYDSGYFDDLKSTVKQLNRALNDPALKDMDFYYQSSW